MDTITLKLLTFFKKKKKSNKDPFDYQCITENQVKLTEQEEHSLECLNKYDMSLCPVEYERYKKFQENHMHRDVNNGVIGGHISIDVTMTSIGACKSCHCSVCGQSANITEYNW